jgi:hypothetical protein
MVDIALASPRDELARVPTASGSPHVSYLPHCGPVPRARPFCRTLDSFQGSRCMLCLGENARQLVAFFVLKEKYREEISDCRGRNARHGDRRRCRRPPTPAARLSARSHRQDADRQRPHRERPDRQGSGTCRIEVLNQGLLKPTSEHDPDPKGCVSAKWKPVFPWLTNAERVCPEIRLKRRDKIMMRFHLIAS